MYTTALASLFLLASSALAVPFEPTIEKRTNDDVICCTGQACVATPGCGIKLLTPDMHLPNRTCTAGQNLFSLPTTGVAFEMYSNLGNFTCYAQNLNPNSEVFYAGLAPDGTFTSWEGNAASLFGKCVPTLAIPYER